MAQATVDPVALSLVVLHHLAAPAIKAQLVPQDLSVTSARMERMAQMVKTVIKDATAEFCPSTRASNVKRAHLDRPVHQDPWEPKARLVPKAHPDQPVAKANVENVAWSELQDRPDFADRKDPEDLLVTLEKST